MSTVNEAIASPIPSGTSPEGSEGAAGRAIGPWTLWLQIVFRFVFSLVALYNLPFPLGLVPRASYLTDWYSRAWHVFVPWVGAHILHLSKPITYFPTGSGDTTSSYVRLLCVVIIAFIATVIWSLLDRRRAQYRTLHEVLRIYVRYVLAYTMFGYGFAKLPYGQFRTPSLDRLIEPYGSFTPMGTLWYFMGVSWAYTIFAGIAEVTGGFLLLFRRTATLGALIVMADMLNVATLNYSYDVPVKLYSTALLLMAVFLLAPEARRLFRFFLLDRPTAPSTVPFPWKSRRRWMGPARAVAKTVIVALALYGTLVPSFRNMLQYPARMAKMRSPLYGIYNVENVGEDAPGDGIHEIIATNWRRVAFTNKYMTLLAVVMADDSMPRYSTKFDTAKHTVALSTYDTGITSVPIGVLRYSQPDANHLVLDGTFNGKPAHVELRKMDASKYRLFNTGFHWINEFSNDR